MKIYSELAFQTFIMAEAVIDDDEENRPQLFQAITLRTHAESIILLYFVLDNMVVTDDNKIRFDIYNIPEQSIQQLRESIQIFNFVKKDIRGIEVLINSINVSSFPRSGTNLRVQIEDKIRNTPRLLEALAAFDNNSNSFLDKFLSWTKNSRFVLRFIYLKWQILEELVIEKIAVEENIILIQVYSNKFTLNTSSRQECREHAKVVDSGIDKLCELITEYQNVTPSFSTSMELRTVQEFVLQFFPLITISDQFDLDIIVQKYRDGSLKNFISLKQFDGRQLQGVIQMNKSLTNFLTTIDSKKDNSDLLSDKLIPIKKKALENICNKAETLLSSENISPTELKIIRLDIEEIFNSCKSISDKLAIEFTSDTFGKTQDEVQKLRRKIISLEDSKNYEISLERIKEQNFLNIFNKNTKVAQWPQININSWSSFLITYRREKSHYQENILLQRIKTCLSQEDLKMCERIVSPDKIINILSQKYGTHVTALKTEVNKLIMNNNRPSNLRVEERNLASLFSILNNLETEVERNVFSVSNIQKLVNSLCSVATSEAFFSSWLKKKKVLIQNEMEKPMQDRLISDETQTDQFIEVHHRKTQINFLIDFIQDRLSILRDLNYSQNIQEKPRNRINSRTLGIEKFLCIFCKSQHLDRDNKIRKYLSVCPTFLSYSVRERISQARKHGFCLVCTNLKDQKHKDMKECPLKSKFKCNFCNIPIAFSHNSLMCLSKDTRSFKEKPRNFESGSGNGNKGRRHRENPRNRDQRSSKNYSHSDNFERNSEVRTQTKTPLGSYTNFENLEFSKKHNFPHDINLLPVFKSMVSNLSNNIKQEILHLSDSG